MQGTSKRVISLLLAISIMFSLFPVTVLADDERVVIETIEGTLVTSKEDDTPSTLEDVFVYGADASQYDQPYIKTVSGDPAYFYHSHWEKETSPGYWEEVASYGFPIKTFTSGNYRYVSRVYVDNDSTNGPSATGGDDYKFNEDVTITVGEETWTKYNYSSSSDSTSITVYKDGFVMPVPDELQFPMSTFYSIPENWVGVAIEELDVSEYTEGGTAPYTYSYVSGPEWLSVSEDGIISGTPTVAADSNPNLVVMVTDSAEATKQISIPVGTTHKDPNTRIVVSNIVATSEDIDEIATVGHEITKPTIVVSSNPEDVDVGYPAYFYNSNSEWEVFDGESWVTATGTFSAGNSYRYKATVYVDNDGTNGPLATAGDNYRLLEDPLPTITLNGEAMTVSADGGYFETNASKVMAYSKTYVMSGDSVVVTGSITVPTIDDLEIGYDEQLYSSVTVSLTSTGTVNSSHMQASLSGEDAESFQIDTNFGVNCVAPNTWNNILFVRPVTGLLAGTYTATLTLKFDSDGDSVYETTIGSDDVSVTVTKKKVTNVAVTIDQEPENGEYYEYADFSHVPTPASTTSWGGAGTGGCRYNVKVGEDWTVLNYGEGNEFVNGKEYQAFVIVSVFDDDEYEFANDVTATINGHDATIWNGGSYVELSYDYGVLSEAPTETTAIEADKTVLNFGSLPIGFSGTQAQDAGEVVRFTNTGTTTIILSNTNPSASGPFGNISYDTESELAPGEYVDVILEPAQGSGYASVIGDYEGTYAFTATNVEDAEDTAVVNIDATVSIVKREITSIELSGSYTAPVVGEAIPELDNEIASVNGEAELASILDLDYIKWMKRTGEGMYEYTDATGTFEDGEEYTIQMFFTVKEEYQSNNKFIGVPATVTLEGAELESCQLNETTLGMWLVDDVTPEVATPTTYTITVINGTADPEGPVVAGTEVEITADEPAEGTEFSHWTVESGEVELADSTSNVTTFEMGTANVEITAHYNTIISEINITGVSLPIVGETASTSATLNTTGLSTTTAHWETLGGEVVTGDPFVAGESYNLVIGFIVNSGYEVDEGATITANEVPEDTYLTTYGSWLSLTYSVPAAEKTQLTIPTLIVDEFTYDKEEKTITISNLDNDNCTVSGDLVATSVGNYTVAVSINDPENYEWSDGSTDDIVLNWSIVMPELSASITVPTFENAEVGYASIISQGVMITISNTYIINPASLEYEITGTNASDFNVSLNKSAGTLNGDGSWSNIFFVGPNDNLSVGTYTAILTLKYDADNDGTYELTVGSGDLSFIVEEATPTTVTHEVTFNSNGGNEVEKQIIEDDLTATKPADPTNGDYVFAGWFVNPTFDTFYDIENETYNTFDFATPITDDIELTALWITGVIVNTNGGGSFTIQGPNIDDSFTNISHPVVIGITNDITLSAVADEYYTFAKWTKDGEDYSENEEIDVTITEEVEYTAIFEPIECTISFNANGGDGEMESESIFAGLIYILPECTFKAPEGKVFDKWNLGKKGANITVTEDIELIAQWKNKPTGGGGGGSTTKTYKITTNMENGTITPSNPSVEKNESQEFKFVANDGYEITDVLVDGQSVGVVDSYKLEKVTAKHTVEVKTQKVSALDKVDDWAKEEMAKADEKGLIPETFENKDATKAISRLEFAAVAVKLYESITGEKATPVVDNPFTDTSDEYVLKAFALGITNGTSETSFTPSASITREQMATMIARALTKAGIDVTVDLESVTRFADDNEMHDWGRPSVYFMAKEEIIKGVGNNNFDPLGMAKVEEAIAIVLRCVEVFAK